MRLKAWHVPLRLATGAYILNSGLSKRSVRGEAAEGLHEFATTGHPELERLEPERFARTLSAGETVLGGALLVPLVPSWAAGAGLAAFGAGLNRLYLRVPGMRRAGDLRPTERGSGLAKDVWMTAMGLALVVDGVLDRVRRRR